MAEEYVRHLTNATDPASQRPYGLRSPAFNCTDKHRTLPFQQTSRLFAQSLAEQAQSILPAMLATSQSSQPPSASEGRLILLLALVQFVVIVDFMMLLPLGPDFASALGIPLHELGWVTGYYTLAAVITGALGAMLLDRFDRRAALVVMLVGMGLAIFSAAFSHTAAQLYAMRMLAGGFAGPASALVFAILADQIPPARRGRALARLMMGFTLASILGVPLGLELARMGGWQLPFLAVGSLTLVISLLIRLHLPALCSHLGAASLSNQVDHLRQVVMRRDHLTAYALILFTLGSSFLVIPHLATYVQFNLAYPREHLGWLYLLGGIASFVSLQLAGHATDRYGPLPVFALGSLAVLTVLSALTTTLLWPAMVLIPGFMVANSLRVVALNTLVSQVPSPAERAGFMALDSVTHHTAISLAGFASASVLGTAGDGTLTGMNTLAWGAALFILFSLPLAGVLWTRLGVRSAQTQARDCLGVMPKRRR